MANANFNLQSNLDKSDLTVLSNRLNEVIGVKSIKYREHTKNLCVVFDGNQTDFLCVKKKIENCGHDISSASFSPPFK